MVKLINEKFDVAETLKKDIDSIIKYKDDIADIFPELYQKNIIYTLLDENNKEDLYKILKYSSKFMKGYIISYTYILYYIEKAIEAGLPSDVIFENIDKILSDPDLKEDKKDKDNSKRIVIKVIDIYRAATTKEESDDKCFNFIKQDKYFIEAVNSFKTKNDQLNKLFNVGERDMLERLTKNKDFVLLCLSSIVNGNFEERSEEEHPSKELLAHRNEELARFTKLRLHADSSLIV